MKIDLTLDYQTVLGRYSPRDEKTTIYSAYGKHGLQFCFRIGERRFD